MSTDTASTYTSERHLTGLAMEENIVGQPTIAVFYEMSKQYSRQNAVALELLSECS